jgi:acetolactate synthase small subunit
VTCFSLRAAAEPGVMPRVLELFAKRNLVPERWHSDVVGPGREELSIDLQVADLAPETGAYIARCLRQIWGVEAVLTSEKRFA